MSNVEWPDANDRRQTTLGAVLSIVIVNVAVQSVLHGLDLSVSTLVAVLVGTLSAVVVAEWIMRVRAGPRRRREVQAALAAGRPCWDLDWTESRRVARHGILARASPRWSYLAALIGSMSLTRIALEGSGGNTETAWVVATGASSLVLLASWIVFRGGVQVTFDRFPYLVGQPATFFVATTEGSPRLADAEVLLRQVGPAYDLEGRILSKRVLVTRWSRQVPVPHDAPPGPDEFIELTVDIPEDLPGTALHGDPPVRWELLVRGRNRWGRVVETFRVPVYAAPAAVPAVMG